jgi:putative endonuclease
LSTFSKGRLGEELACSYLKGCAVKILKRNLRSPFGEVDIIGVEGRVLVFFEVKYFQNGSIADLENVIDPKKQNRILQTAQWYLEGSPLDYDEIRFDAVFINNASVHWIKDAFSYRGNCDLF